MNVKENSFLIMIKVIMKNIMMQNALFAQVSTLQMHVIKPTKIAKQILYAQCVKKKEKKRTDIRISYQEATFLICAFLSSLPFLFRYEETEYFPTVFFGKFQEKTYFTFKTYSDF